MSFSRASKPTTYAKPPAKTAPTAHRRSKKTGSKKTGSKKTAAQPTAANRREKYGAKKSGAKKQMGRTPVATTTTNREASKQARRAEDRHAIATRRQSTRKLLMAGGSVATLAALAIVPPRVGSQAIALSSCQEVVRSGAEISRGQISSLLALPTGSRKEAVQQAINTPYCLLPAVADKNAADKNAADDSSQKNHSAQQSGDKKAAAVADVVEREAYPLAFDPEAWVVVSYVEEKYVGYDFVFKP
ncbi:MAG: hypothetical protein AAF171_24315 [Cyanobacteria bacterium P01_A01_bin.116]